MRKKIYWLGALMLICALSLTLVFKVEPVKAQGQNHCNTQSHPRTSQ